MAETRWLVLPDDTRIAWDESGSGPAVVLVHGLGSTRKRWDRMAAELVASGFRAIRLDLRGFGESSPARGAIGMNELSSDLSRLVDELALARFHLLGHSLGGMLAQRYTVEHPARVATLTLASTTSHNGRRASAFARAMTLLAEHGFDSVLNDPGLRADVLRVLSEAFPGSDPPLDMLRIGVEQPNPARANAWRACVDFSEKDRLGQIACPVLVLHGDADPLIPFRAGELVHQAIPGSEWHPEPGAGHSLPTERAESFQRRVLAFLERHRLNSP